MKKARILRDLFFTFMQVGGLTFGGGYAMLPILQREVVEKRGWATDRSSPIILRWGNAHPVSLL